MWRVIRWRRGFGTGPGLRALIVATGPLGRSLDPGCSQHTRRCRQPNRSGGHPLGGTHPGVADHVARLGGHRPGPRSSDTRPVIHTGCLAGGRRARAGPPSNALTKFWRQVVDSAAERLTVANEDPGTVTAFGQTAGVTPCRGTGLASGANRRARGNPLRWGSQFAPAPFRAGLARLAAPYRRPWMGSRAAPPRTYGLGGRSPTAPPVLVTYADPSSDTSGGSGGRSSSKAWRARASLGLRVRSW